MATIPTIQLLRNNNIYSSRADARSALEGQKGNVPDGGVILARYSGTTGEQMIIKTLAGFVSNISTPQNATVTIIDVEGAINNISGETAVEEGKFISAITQTNGVVTARLGGVAAANVSVADEGNIFTATTVEGVLSEIQNAIGTGGSVGTQITNAINALDSEKSGSSTSNHITVGVKQVDGKISSVTVSDSDIASATLLGAISDTKDKATAFGRIAQEAADREAAIGALNFGPVSGTGKVITAITQTNGVVNATADTLSASSVAFRSSGTSFTADNVKDALDTLYTRSGDGSKVVIDSGTTTEGYSKTYTFTQGGIEIGKIDIPKDLVVKSGSVVKGNWNDGVFTENVSGSGTALKLVIANKEETPIYINTLDLVKDHTGGNGISISDTNVISVKIDSTSEEFLTVEANGIKLSGVTDAISAASGHVNTIIDARLGTGVTSESTATAQFAALSGQITSINATIENLDATVSGESTHVDVTVGQANGIITSVTVANEDIASASVLTSETSARQTADTELSNRLGTGVTTAEGKTVTAQLQALSGETSDTSGATSVKGAKAYAKDLVDNLHAEVESKIKSETEITTTKAIKIIQNNGKIESITLGAFDCGTY